MAFDAAVFKDRAIRIKDKELMVVAVALTTQCLDWIEIHAQRAKKAGATEQELAETTLVTAALRAGGAMMHSTHTLERWTGCNNASSLQRRMRGSNAGKRTAQTTNRRCSSLHTSHMN